MKSLQLRVGNQECYMQINGLMPLDEALLEKYTREMFLDILYKELDYNARIYKLENALHDVVSELQNPTAVTTQDYLKRERVIKNAYDALDKIKN